MLNQFNFVYFDLLKREVIYLKIITNVCLFLITDNVVSLAMGKSARRSFDRSSSPLRSAKINNEPYVYYQQSTGQPETNLWSTNEVMTQESLSLGKPLK